MKQVRNGVFETNSSSVHSFTLATSEEVKDFRAGKLLFDRYGDKLVKEEDMKHLLDENSPNYDEDAHYQFQTYDELSEDWEVLTEKHEVDGKDIYIVGYYGRDG